jgi:uncharacterized membrane protein YccC
MLPVINPMNVSRLLSRLKAFIRQESFEPDTSRALLVTIALITPITISHIIGKPLLGVFVGLTAQLLTSARWQGAYPQRAILIFTGTICIGIAAFFGTLSGAYLLTAALFMALVAFLASLARGLGDYGQTLGICAVILFLFSLRAPNDLATAFERMGLVYIGGAWAAFLLLFYWPISPNLPLLLKIAHPWEICSSLMQAIATHTFIEAEEDDAFTKKNNSLRVAINTVFSLSKRHMNGLTAIRRDLLKINRIAYRFGATTVALRDELANMPADIRSLELMASVEKAAATLAKAAQVTADAIVTQKKKQIQPVQDSVAQAKAQVVELHDKAVSASINLNARLAIQHIISLLESAITYLDTVLSLLNRMQLKQETRQRNQALVIKFNIRQWWQKILFRLQPNAILLKHSQRVAIVTVAGLVLYYSLDLPRGQWIVLTIMVLLQPDFSTTKERTQDRLMGTMAGVVIGTLLLIYHLHFSLLVLAISVCAFFFVYLQAKNYKLAVVFVTIMLVGILEVSEFIGWQIAAYRLLATLIGGMLSILAAYVLWPSWESMQFPARLSKALLANKNLLWQIGHELQDKTGFHARVVSDQRKAEAENINLLDTVKRLAQEPDSIRDRVKNAQKLAYYNNRLTNELTSFAAFLPSLKADFDYAEASTIINELARIIEGLAADIAQNKPIHHKPDLDAILKRMEVEIKEIEQILQNSSQKPQLLEEMVLNYELIYSLLDKIAHELGSMINLMDQETDVKASSPVPASPVTQT